MPTPGPVMGFPHEDICKFERIERLKLTDISDSFASRQSFSSLPLLNENLATDPANELSVYFYK